jgi:threonine synthase
MNYISTRNNQQFFDADQVLNLGLAPDGGLFVPTEFPLFNIDKINQLKGKSYHQIAYFILEPFLKDIFNESEIELIIESAYANFDEGIISITPIGKNSLLNLFHGPTFAFKDYAMCLLAKIYEFYLKKNNKKLVIVGATSGDTGSAAIQAFKGIENIKIFILHPHNSTSLFQRKQMTTSSANNVFNIALHGSFDDCQTLVKKVFRDEKLNKLHNFTAINSINWFRILPQSVYYAWSYLNYGQKNFVVPSGNFGNVYSAYLLKKMGFPIDKLVVASNENNILHRIIKNNDLTLNEVIKTNSPSMDILISSNFERLLSEFLGPIETDTLYQSIILNKHNKHLNTTVHNQLLKNFISESCNSNEVLEQIKKTYDEFGVVIDPHTAVGVRCAEKLNLEDFMCLACAHPVKFQETVKKALNVETAFDKDFNFNKSEVFDELENNYDLLKEYIINNG